MAKIEIKDLDVRYGRFRALNGVTCSIDGGAVGLLGPNGAGKSTLIKSLLGFLRPASGSLTMFGLTMPGHFLEVRQRLGYMPEREVVSPKVSAVSFLTYNGVLCGMTRVDAMERAHEVLNYVGMGDDRYRKMETYSTGMLQRVKFGAALIHDPKVLLLDEPTNGLDPDGRIEMLNLIRNLPRKRHITIVLSSHLLPDVEYVCDRLIMIRNGAIVREGAMEEITGVREGLYEVRVRENGPAFAAAVRDAGCTLEERNDGTYLVSKPSTVGLQIFFQAAQAHNTQVRHLRPVRHSLEEAFMEAMNPQ